RVTAASGWVELGRWVRAAWRPGPSRRRSCWTFESTVSPPNDTVDYTGGRPFFGSPPIAGWSGARGAGDVAPPEGGRRLARKPISSRGSPPLIPPRPA